MVPPRSVERVAELAREVATAALAGEHDRVQSLLDGQRQTSLLPWLAQRISDDGSQIPVVARQILTLLSGPLLLRSHLPILRIRRVVYSRNGDTGRRAGRNVWASKVLYQNTVASYPPVFLSCYCRNLEQ